MHLTPALTPAFTPAFTQLTIYAFVGGPAMGDRPDTKHTPFYIKIVTQVRGMFGLGLAGGEVTSTHYTSVPLTQPWV